MHLSFLEAVFFFGWPCLAMSTIFGVVKSNDVWSGLGLPVIKVQYNYDAWFLLLLHNFGVVAEHVTRLFKRPFVEIMFGCEV